MTPSKFLPSHPSFESIRKQAKKLIRQFAAGDPDALARVQNGVLGSFADRLREIRRRQVDGKRASHRSEPAGSGSEFRRG